MKLNHWTEEDESLLKEQYQKFEIDELVKIFPNRTASSLKTKVLRLGLKKRKYRFMNDFYFNKSTVENCAIAGLLAADGCVMDDNRLYLGLAKKDFNFLKIVAQKIGYVGNFDYHRKIINFSTYPSVTNKNNKMTICESFSLNVISELVIKDLKENFNIIPRKTLVLQPPKLSDKIHILSFLSGLICGDGCIAYSKSKEAKIRSLHINFLGTQPLLEWVKNFCDDVTPLDKNSNILKYGAKIYFYSISGIRAYIFSKLFLTLDIPRLDRKWDIARGYINEIEQKEKKNELSAEILCKLKRMRPYLDLFLNSISQNPVQSVKPVAITNLN